VFAQFAASWGLQRGYSTNAFAKPQFATSIQVLPASLGRIEIARRDAVVELSWTNQAPQAELWSTTNLADGPWAPWPVALTTNGVSLTNVTGQQFFRLRLP
jgi:hypothetical protein